MSNPANAFFEDAKGTIILVLFAAIVIYVLTVMGAAFGMPELTNQMISSIGVGVLLILAIPPIGAFIALVIWIVKQIEDSGGSYY
jgi:uncharacterized membrane protein